MSKIVHGHLPDLGYAGGQSVCALVLFRHQECGRLFKMDLSRSRRAIRASSSWVSCCLGVNALLCDVTPVRSCWSWLIQWRNAGSTTPSERQAPI